MVDWWRVWWRVLGVVRAVRMARFGVGRRGREWAWARGYCVLEPHSQRHAGMGSQPLRATHAHVTLKALSHNPQSAPCPPLLTALQICPILLDLINSMDKIATLPPDFPPREKVRVWYSKMYQKPANYELPEEDVRQLMYELEASYNTFLATLRKK